ncbi:MAG: hypothetical protein K0B15_07375 [Lentimicrobium sp.]|nr:hypothetical protein [Lentimicrobium sp.]
MKEQEIYEKAKRLFTDFENGIIDIDLFQSSLTDLARHLNFLTSCYTIDDFVAEYIKPQFDDYRDDPKRYRYLLSVYSSGSLLTQFEPYQE